MLSPTISRFHNLLNTLPAKLIAIPADVFSYKPAPNKWSKKEIIGHLTDSAANNHQRFVRIPFQLNPHIVYEQDNWVKHNYHQQKEQKDVIHFWEVYNRHLLFVIEQIPNEDLARTCYTNGTEPVTLKWLIEDYVSHMEHHLREVLVYE
jgi:hypothetical protein